MKYPLIFLCISQVGPRASDAVNLPRFLLRPCPSSVVFIHGCHPWMASTDDTSIHGWHFSIHGWHPWMAFLHPWMTLLHPCITSTDDISPSMDDIQGWHFHPWMRFLHPWMGFSFVRFLVKIATKIDTKWPLVTKMALKSHTNLYSALQIKPTFWPFMIWFKGNLSL